MVKDIGALVSKLELWRVMSHKTCRSQESRKSNWKILCYVRSCNLLPLNSL